MSHISPFTTLGGAGGSKDKTLTQAQIPVFSGTFNHTAGDDSTVSGIVSHTSVGSYKEGAVSGTTISNGHRISFGGGQAHDVMNPYILVNYEVIAG